MRINERVQVTLILGAIFWVALYGSVIVCGFTALLAWVYIITKSEKGVE